MRVPGATGSLIILTALIQDESLTSPSAGKTSTAFISRPSSIIPKGYLVYSEEQNVSADIIGLPRAAAVIEGHENHTRTCGSPHQRWRWQPKAGVPLDHRSRT